MTDDVIRTATNAADLIGPCVLFLIAVWIFVRIATELERAFTRCTALSIAFLAQIVVLTIGMPAVGQLVAYLSTLWSKP